MGLQIKVSYRCGACRVDAAMVDVPKGAVVNVLPLVHTGRVQDESSVQVCKYLGMGTNVK